MRRLAFAFAFLITAAAFAQTPPASAPAAQDAADPELEAIGREDQADRSPASGKVDWAVVAPRDKAREARVKELYRADRLRTGRDLFLAALVLQHAEKPEDYLLAHELCVAALAKGYGKARWLATASEDRFLLAIGRKQRFATQYHGDPGKLDPVDEGATGVTDALRRKMGAPTLAEAREREEMLADWALPLEKRAAKYEKRAAESPRDVKTQLQLVDVYAAMKRDDDMLAASKRALALDPTLSYVHYNVACLEARKGRKAEALDALAAAFRAGFKDADHARRDEDLAPIRSDPRFEEILKPR